MGIKQKLVAVLLGVVMALALAQCNGSSSSDNDNNNGNNLRTWLQVARFINNQLGDVSDGTAATCGGNAAANIGDHCKNQLKGEMNAEMITQLVRGYNDFFLNIAGLGDQNVLFRRGFVPQTADPCDEDMNGNGTEDYKEVCGGAAQLLCTGRGIYNYDLEYVNCAYNDGVAWILDGTLEINTQLTQKNELLVIGNAIDYREERVADNVAFTLDGKILRYQRINPATGAPTEGTQGGQDGMEIIWGEVTVDSDGDGADDVGPYRMSLVNDFEDGIALINRRGQATYIYPRLPAATLLIDFYDRDLPRDGHKIGEDAGCEVQIPLADIDLVNRQYDYTSTADCLGNGVDVDF